MAFFDPLPADSEPPEPQLAPPSWVPCAIPFQALAARTDEVGVSICGVLATPVGFEFTVRVNTKHIPQPTRGLGRRPPDPVEGLRVGVQFPDGRKAGTGQHGGHTAVLRANAAGGDDAGPAPLMLLPSGGGGGGGDFTYRYRIPDLPTDGAISFVIEWEQFGIPETWVALDGTAIRAAGLAAEPIWPIDPAGVTEAR